MRQPIGIQATYTIDEMLGTGVISLSQQALRRLLEKNGVEFIQSGRSRLIPISELQQKVPLFWEAFTTAIKLRSEIE